MFHRADTSLLLLVSLICLCTPALAGDTPVPPRSTGGQCLAVPQEHLDLGEIYHVTPGGDTQLICFADAPLIRFAAVCNRVVGYVVTPFDVEEGQPPILAGALRIPVASLRVGLESLDGELHGPSALSAAEYPEFTVQLTKITDVQLVSEENDRRSYTLTATAALAVKDKTVELTVPLQVLMVPFTWQSMSRNLGDLLIVRARFDAKLTDLGLDAPRGGAGDLQSDALTLDVFLMCSTVSPEKNLDPGVSTESYEQLLQFLTLLRDFQDPDRAYAFGRECLKKCWDDGPALNRLAWAALTEQDVPQRDLAFVAKAAERANELASAKDAETLRTLARLAFERGDVAAAVKYAQQAAEHLDGLPPYTAGPIQADLQRYEAHAAAEKD